MSSDFFKRWSDKKQHASSDLESNAGEAEETQVSHNVTPPEVNRVEDEHADDLEPENQSTSVAALLKDVKADKVVKKAALRKLFLQPEFNVVDGLNDYDHDYSAVKHLTVDVAQTLRDWINDDSVDDDCKLSQQTPDSQSLAEKVSAEQDNVSIQKPEAESSLEQRTSEPHTSKMANYTHDIDGLNQVEKGVKSSDKPLS